MSFWTPPALAVHAGGEGAGRRSPPAGRRSDITRNSSPKAGRLPFTSCSTWPKRGDEFAAQALEKQAAYIGRDCA